MPPQPQSTPLHTEVDGRPLTLTSLERQLYSSGFSKAEAIDYYLRIAPVMLPHLLGRCLTRRRFPRGTSAESFYEKNVPAGAPDWLATQRVDAADTPVNYPLADSPATLVWLANLSALEIHVPQWRVDGLATGAARPQEPIPLEAEELVLSDRLVVDLDPGPQTTMVDSARAAMVVATELARDGMVPFVKTSGSKGLQVFAPIEPTPWQQVVAHVRSLAESLASRAPDQFVAVMAKDQRPGRIFIDYLQNRASRNTVAVYSLRGLPRESVSTPVTWDEVAAVDQPDALRFTPAQMLQRVEEHGDLWFELLQETIAAPVPRPTGTGTYARGEIHP